MQIEILRQACCAADDQLGPLELILNVAPSDTLQDLVTWVVAKGFLQYSSTHTAMIGSVGNVDLVRVYSPYHCDEKSPEYFVDPKSAIGEVIKNGQMHFRF